MKTRINEVLEACTSSGSLQGVAAIVVNNEERLYEGAFGTVAADGAAMTTDTVCAIASMTKAITGAAAMQLVEQGQLSLDAPAAEICTELNELQVFTGRDANGTPQFRPPASPITLRQLLSHSSGLVYDLWNKDFQTLCAELDIPSFATLKRAALQVPLMFDPGTAWEYGLGIDWAGLMVEAVSGKSLGDYFAADLTGPLGMTQTGFRTDQQLGERVAPLHLRQSDGSLIASPIDPLAQPEAPEFQSGGAGLLSTTADYARFLQMLLRGGELDGTRVLQSQTVDLMGQNQIGDLRVKLLPTAVPPISNDAELFPGEAKGWGLTFQVHLQSGHTGRPAGTLMWAGATNCYYWIDRTNNVAGLMVTQVLPFADAACLQAYYDLETAVYESLGAAT